MFELCSFPPLQGPFLKGITDARKIRSPSKAALTNASGLVSHPADMETGLGMNSASPPPQHPRSPSLGPLFSLALEGTEWTHTCDAKYRATLLLDVARHRSSQNCYSKGLETNPHPTRD